jgi:hypothetical protein
MLLFGMGHEHHDLRVLAAALVTTLTGSDPRAEVSRGLVWATRIAGPYLSDQQKSTAREALKSLSDDLLAPLFEAPIDLWPVEGPVAASYVARLTAWDATGEQGQVEVAVERLSQLVEAGWSDPPALREIAARVNTQIPALADHGESAQMIDGLLGLVQLAPAGDEIDQLARSMIASPGTSDPAARIASVLSLAVRPETKPDLEKGISKWLQSADVDSVARLTHGLSSSVIGWPERVNSGRNLLRSLMPVRTSISL